jgi:hypothetical protein
MVPRDLETICLSGLQKEPVKRFADCAALAEDLRRFVAGEPIRARPVSASERLWRWCRRNPRVAALSASVLFLVFLVLGGSIFFNFKLKEEKDFAEQKEQEAQDQRKVALSALGDMVTSVQAELRNLPGRQELQKKLLKIAMNSLRHVSENPKAKISLKDSTLAAAHYGLAGIYEGLGELDSADDEYRLADAAYAEQVKADPTNSQCRANHALALMALGRVNLRRQGHGHEAGGFFGKASDVLATLDEGQGEGRLSPRQVRELRADALLWQGVLLMDTNPRRGRDYYQRSVELRGPARTRPLARRGTASGVATRRRRRTTRAGPPVSLSGRGRPQAAQPGFHSGSISESAESEPGDGGCVSGRPGKPIDAGGSPRTARRLLPAEQTARGGRERIHPGGADLPEPGQPRPQPGRAQ